MEQERDKLVRIYSDSDGEYEKGEIRGEEVDLIPISGKRASILQDKVIDWLYITSTKLQDMVVYSVSQDSRFDLEELLSSPKSFFHDDVWEWLDDAPKNDFQEAIRALAFGSPTACVMLCLRAVEYCLRLWYEDDTEREIENRTWGQVIGELEDVYEDVEDRPAVLSNLDYLRDRRNAVSHPEEHSSQREAERMLLRTEGTITELKNQMNS
jgi:hypothetical protein